MWEEGVCIYGTPGVPNNFSAYIMNFMDLKLTLWLINRTIEKKNKVNKHTCNRMDGDFDKTIYYK